jgi:hypothetical protein
MVLVFGIDVPLFEFLLVFMILLTAGLVFILIELRRLNDYLRIERADLKRLERDLGVLEVEEQKLGEEEAKIDAAPRPVKAAHKRPKRRK